MSEMSTEIMGGELCLRPCARTKRRHRFYDPEYLAALGCRSDGTG